jgi:chemotaxis protein MotB
MIIVKIHFSLVAIVAAMLLTTGCVSKTEFDSLQVNYNNLQTTNSQLTRDGNQCKENLNRATAQISSMQQQINDEQQHVKDLQATLDKCLTTAGQGNANISKLLDQVSSSNKYIQELMASKTTGDSLNMALTNNLTRSLTGGELQDVEVKVLKGMVYLSLADNMLYLPGSYDISNEAGDILAKIAKIINDYKGYDVLVEGNTDSVSVSEPNIRNNWDLSALRASSVVLALQDSYGVDPQRLTAGGRGEYNPVASNDTPEGRSLNRRTEIIITPKLNQLMDLIDKGKAPDSTNTQ